MRGQSGQPDRERRSSCAQTLAEKWEREREALAGAARLKEEIERVVVEATAAERASDLERASELKYGTLSRLRAQLAEAEASLRAREVRGWESLAADRCARLPDRTVTRLASV